MLTEVSQKGEGHIHKDIPHMCDKKKYIKEINHQRQQNITIGPHK